jgi:hypothetical protein
MTKSTVITIVAGAALLVAAVLARSMVPELARYLRIRRM